MVRTLVFSVAILSVVVFARADSTAKSAELSTPKLAALAFVRAMEQNNMQSFQAVTIGGEDDYKLFEPLLGMVGAAKQMEKSAHEEFGKAGRVVARNSPAVGLEVQVQESDVTINGSSAILRYKGDNGSDPLTIRQTPEGWKVDLTAIKNRQAMADAAPGMRRMQQVFSGAADDIRAGKFKSATEAEQAVLQKIREASAAADPGSK